MQSIRYFFVLCCIWLSSAKAQDLNFININTDNGLPSNECYRIVQDKQGYIWVSTEMGLAKYNGREFILFDAAKGLPYRNIYALDADSSGRVWFATGDWKVGYILNDKVVYILEGLPEKTHEYVYARNNSDANFVYKMCYFDKSETLYISSTGFTLSINLRNNNKVKIFETTPFTHYFFTKQDGTKSYIGNCLDRRSEKKHVDSYFVPDFDVYISNGNYLSLKNSYKKENYSLVNTELFSQNVNEDFAVIAQQRKLFIVEQMKKITLEKEMLTQVLCLFIDGKKSIWTGCKNNGLYYFNNTHFNQVFHYLERLSVSNIIEDCNGSLWVTTLEKGIFFCNNKANYALKKPFGKETGKNFIGIADNKLFISNSEIQLGFLKQKHYLPSTILPQIHNNKIEPSCIAYHKKQFFLGSPTGLYVLDKDFKVSRELYSNAAQMTIGVKDFFLDKQGNLCTFYSKYLGQINSKIVKEFSGKELPKIKSILVLPDNNFLAATKGGIYIVDRKSPTDEYKYASREKYKVSSISSVNKLYQDSSTNYWLLPFNDSINVLDSNFHLKSLIIINSKNLICREILEVDKTTFLVSSNKGIIYIHFKDKTFKTYSLKIFDETHGINSSDVYKVLFFNKKFYVSTSKGICIFDKIEDLYHQSTPNTIISSIKVNDSSINAKIDTEFIYKRNNFSFIIDALTYKKINQKGIFFKYKLVGFDADFKTAGGYEISYNNLPPGTYTFIAKAFYDDDTEDPTPATYTFTIKHPFWQTWWGLSSMIVAGIFLIYLLIEWRIKKIRKEEEEKAAINQTIAEYKLTALKAQMNPHFIFNSINVIQNLILEKDKNEAYNSLTKFSKLIRKILNQSDSVFSTIEEELELINSYVELNKLRVEYPFEFFTEIAPETLQFSIPSLIIQPFIENALWHGVLPLKGTKVGIIKLTIKLVKENILLITIQDNGIGRKSAAKHKPVSEKHISKGLTLINERLQAYRVLNNNCIAQVEIEDVEDDSFTGTNVEITIELTNNYD